MRKIAFVVIIAMIATLSVMAGGQREAPTTQPEVTPSRDAEFTLKLAHADATDVYTSRKHTQAIAFASMVNSRSNGRINVEVYGGGALGGEREYVEGIQGGTIEAGIASGVMGSFFPPAMVTDIPFLFPSAAVAWEVMDGPFGDRLREQFLRDTGVRCLGFAEVGFRHFTNNRREIRSPADMRGLRFRVQETPLYVNMVRSLGATPTPIAWPEVYTALQTGVVDGQENPVPVILAANFPEVQQYVTLNGHVYGVDWFLINEDFFQSLPADLQFVVLDSARISNAVGRGVQNALNATGVDVLRERGMQVYVPTPSEMEQFRQAAQPAVISWLETQIDRSLIDAVLAEVDRVVEKAESEF
jgi:TRAP-type transport system periplasmic protein